MRRNDNRNFILFLLALLLVLSPVLASAENQSAAPDETAFSPPAIGLPVAPEQEAFGPEEPAKSDSAPGRISVAGEAGDEPDPDPATTDGAVNPEGPGQPPEPPKPTTPPALCVIQLEPGPFAISTAAITVTEGGLYGPLPLPAERKYYSFLGWFTAPGGGTRVGEATPIAVSGAGILFAKWTTQAFALRFDPNGGSVPVATHDYSYGKAYQDLPIPRRPGYSFEGWYTAKVGGKRIEKQTTVAITGETVVYARWGPVWYLQNDTRWKSTWYRLRKESSTVGNAGCGPSSMAMAIAALKDPAISPVEACAWSLSHGYKAYLSGTYDAYFKAHGKAYGIKVTQLNTTNLAKMSRAKATAYQTMALNAVKRGDFVIALMGKGNWTAGGHFVLWYGVEGNQVLIRDSASPAAGRAKNSYSLFKGQVKRFWIISVPDDKKLNPA